MSAMWSSCTAAASSGSSPTATSWSAPSTVVSHGTEPEGVMIRNVLAAPIGADVFKTADTVCGRKVRRLPGATVMAR
jgi:hypothetical protein